MSARQFAEWQAYGMIEPFGPPAAFWQAGVIAATLANAHRDPKKHPKAFQPEDFMPKGLMDQQAHEIDPEAAARAIAGRFQAFAALHRAQGGDGHHGQ
jgi:hypothetical protein